MTCLSLKGIFGEFILGLILNFAILFFCVKHLLDYSRPVVTTSIYAGSFLALGLLRGMFLGWGEHGLLLVFISLFVDVVTGFLFFWFLARYRNRPSWFYGMIGFVIAANIVAHFQVPALVFPNVKGGESLVTAPIPASAGLSSSPPNLWSHHEVLEVTAEVCAQRGLAALQSLSFSSIVRSGNYVYGNSRANRAAVKCVELDGGSSFLYVAVAGPVKRSVEELRNQIAWSMKRT